jgi:hypothetical protein
MLSADERSLMRKLLLSLFAALGMLLSLTSVVAAEPAPAGQESGTRHCATVIDKVQPGQKESTIVSRICADDSQSLRQMQSADCCQWLLVKYWAEGNFSGDAEEIYGYSGSCNTSGYGIPDTAPLQDRISSYRLFGDCNSATIYDGFRYEGNARRFNQVSVDAGTLGIEYNDKVRSMWVRKV